MSTRILSLKARNIKQIREVAIDDVGDLHEIRGDANQGKTSILDAIEGAINGLDPDMVRRGENCAELELCLSEATIKRIVEAQTGKETLMVSDKNGKSIEHAKDFLRTICGPANFRPVTFVQMGRGEKKGRTERLRRQRDMLLEALDLSLTDAEVAKAVKALGMEYARALKEVNLDGVDFEQHPFVVCRALYKAVYDFRSLQNSRLEEAEERFRNTPAPATTAPEKSIEECQAIAKAAIEACYEARAMTKNRGALAEQRDTLAAKVEVDAKRLPTREKVEKTAKAYKAKLTESEATIADLEAKLAEAKAERDEAAGKVEQCRGLWREIESHEADKTDLATMNERLTGEADGPNLDDLMKAMTQAEADVEARQRQDAHDEAAAAAIAAQERAAIFTELVKLFRDDLPKQLLASANLPVPGLSVDDEKILIDGVPLHQLGGSKQIRLGVLIAHALNPRSAFVLVDGAESMGSEDRKSLADTAAELGIQLIMTFVDAEAKPGAGVTVMADGVKLSA